MAEVQRGLIMSDNKVWIAGITASLVFLAISVYNFPPPIDATVRERVIDTLWIIGGFVGISISLSFCGWFIERRRR